MADKKIGLNKNTAFSAVPKKEYREVVLIKLLILFVVFAVPLSLIFIDISQQLSFVGNNPPSAQNNQPTVNGNSVNNQENEYNFDSTLPADKVGDLSNVPKAELDSLFSNLK